MSCWKNVETSVVTDVNHMLAKMERLRLPAEKRYPRKPTPAQSSELRGKLIQIIEKTHNMSCFGLETRSPDFELSFRNGSDRLCFRFHVNKKGSVLTLNGCAS